MRRKIATKSKFPVFISQSLESCIHWTENAAICPPFRRTVEPVTSSSDRLLDLLQLLKLRLCGVILVERVTTADEAVARSGRAITESAADKLPLQFALRHRVSEDVRISQRHPTQANHVRPSVANDILRHVRQVFLQVTVGGAD